MASFLLTIMTILLPIATSVDTQECSVDNICSRYREPPVSGVFKPNFCWDCLVNDARTINASPGKGLAAILLDCAVASAAGALDKAAALNTGGSKRMPSCVQALENVHIALTNAVANVQSNDLGKAGMGVAVCLDSYKFCVDALGGKASVPSELIGLMNKLKGHCEPSYDTLGVAL